MQYDDALGKWGGESIVQRAAHGNLFSDQHTHNPLVARETNTAHIHTHTQNRCTHTHVNGGTHAKLAYNRPHFSRSSPFTSAGHISPA